MTPMSSADVERRSAVCGERDLVRSGVMSSTQLATRVGRIVSAPTRSSACFVPPVVELHGVPVLLCVVVARIVRLEIDVPLAEGICTL
jgi:hypothetical protein